MLNIKMNEFGVENTLTEIRYYLKDAIGDKVSKKRKDEAICKALGAVEALFNMIEIINLEDDMGSEEDKEE